MATIARMVIGIGADPGGLRQDLERSAAILQQFGTTLQGTLGKVDLFGNLNPQAAKAVRSLVEGLGTQYTAQITTLREQLAAGLIDPAAFQVAGGEAAATFQAGLRTGFKSFTDLKLVDANIATGIVAQFRTIGATAGQAMGRGTAVATQGLVTLGNTGPQVNRGLSMIRSGMQAVAVQAVGVSGPVGTLASGLLMFGAGSLVVTGVVAGIGAIALAYRALTKEAREAQQAQKDLLAEVRQLTKVRLATEDPLKNVFQPQLEAIREQFTLVSAELQTALTPKVIGTKGGTITVAPDLAGIAELRQQLLDLRADAITVGKSLFESLSVDPDPTGIIDTGQVIAAVADESRSAFELLRESIERANLALEAAKLDGSILDTGAVQTAINELERLRTFVGLEIIVQGGRDTADINIVRQYVDLTRRLADERARLAKTQIGPLIPPGEIVVPQAILDLRPPVEDAEHLLETISQVSVAIEGIISSGAFGEMDEDLRRSIQSALGLVQALDQIKQASAAGGAGLGSLAGITGVVGAIGAAVGLLSSLFGGMNESDELMRQNNERLREVRDSLDARLRGADAKVGARDALAGIRGSLPALDALSHFAAGLEHTRGGFQELLGLLDDAGLTFQDWIDAGGSQQLAMQELEKQLAEFGLTFAQLEAIAKDNGIQLLDSHGRIVAGAFDQLAEMLGIVLEDLTRFGLGLEDQRARLQLRDAIDQVEEGPTATINRELELLGDFAPAIAAMFAGIDVSTIEGRTAMRAALQGLFDLIDAGLLTGTQLGDLESIDELLSIINALTGGLNDMEGAVTSMTHTLLGVPEAFRVAFHRAEAQDVLPQQPPVGGWPLTPNLPPPPGWGTLTVNVGEIKVDGGADPKATALAVKRELENISLATFGTKRQWSNL